MPTHRLLLLATVFAAASLSAACGQKTADEPTTEAVSAPAAEDPAAASVEAAPAALPRTPSPEDAGVYFVSPADGDTVSNPVRIEFGITGMSVVPAGDMTEHSGHHHLIVDAELPDPGMPIPADDNHIHFGDGSSSTELTLEPGQHTLQLILGDHLHIPHDPPVTSDPITITVE
jgi:hypothetical protein